MQRVPTTSKETKAVTVMESKPSAATKEQQVDSKHSSKRKREESPPATVTTSLDKDSFLYLKSEALPFTEVRGYREKQAAGQYLLHRLPKSWPEGVPEGSSSFAGSSQPICNDLVKEEFVDSMSQVAFDVTGRWHMYTKTSNKGWSRRYDRRNGMTMTVYRSKEGSRYQLWALFDFNVFEGVFRFMEPEKSLAVSPNAIHTSKVTSSKHTILKTTNLKSKKPGTRLVAMTIQVSKRLLSTLLPLAYLPFHRRRILTCHFAGAGVSADRGKSSSTTMSIPAR